MAGRKTISEGDQLDAVSEDVFDVTPLDPGNLAVFANGNSGSTQFDDEPAVVGAGERRMRFPGRTKILFHAQMNLNIAASEPETTPLGEVGRLWNFFHAEESTVELAGLIFVPFRHGKLNVG